VIDYSKYLFKNYTCSCGKIHNVSTKKIVIGKNEIENLANYINELRLPKRFFVVFDENTYNVIGSKVLNLLTTAGEKPRYYIYQNKDIHHVNEKAIGILLMEMDPVPESIIAVGSGTINDLARFCASRLKIPYFVITTAPSMDGYVSNVIPVTKNGIKITYNGVAPEMALADLVILKNSPIELAAAGFGDIIGKVPANLDWHFGNIIFGEEICPEVETLMNSSVSKCLKSACGIKTGKIEAYKELTDALMLSGIAMQMQGNSRPASGAEHHMSHFLEIRDRGFIRPNSYHGTKVGITTLISMKLYEKLFSSNPPHQNMILGEDVLRENHKRLFDIKSDAFHSNRSQFYINREEWDYYRKLIIHKWDYFRAKVNDFEKLRKQFEIILKECSGAVSPQDLGYTKSDILDTIIYGRFMRNRITILEVLANWGLLEQYAFEIVEDFF